jgi:hypothetical protein
VTAVDINDVTGEPADAPVNDDTATEEVNDND